MEFTNTINMIDLNSKFTNEEHSLSSIINCKNNMIEQEITQKNKKKCWLCKKKVGLLGFECACKFVYCFIHRHAEKHDCTFDYKTRDKQILQDNMVVLDRNKVNHI